MKIGSKITLLLCVVVITSLTAVGLFTYIKSSDVVFKQAKSEMMLVNQKTGETMNALLSKEISAMNTIARQKAIIDFLASDNSNKTTVEYAAATEEISKGLDTYVKDYGNTEHIFIIDKSGFIVADSDRNLIGKDLNDRE
jgi:methyl-accepting chemotaxis protein